MSEQLFSPNWYRVASLTPRLRAHAKLHRHHYREQLWYVLQDRSNERFHRFSPSAYAVIGLMDGRRTVQEVWELASARLGDDAPTQPEVIQLLSQLHATDVLQCDIPPDTAELLRRHETKQQQKWKRRLMSFFAWQFPLFDPERLLNRFTPFFRPCFTQAGSLLWLAFVVPALALGAVHWQDLTGDIVDQATAPQNLILLWLLFPVIKILHEFGHAFAVKVFGGEVHEMGIMLLVFTPVPYVDASASSAFASKWRRATVGAAGMFVELTLAAAALFVWVSVEPGTVRTLAYNTILIAGISTVLFNANPLLRFDGYYILGDLIEIPNLRQRATAYLGYLCEAYLFGRDDATVPAATPSERAWFVGYGVSSFVYRVLVVTGILLYLTDQFFWVGVIFAALTSVTWFVMPIGKGLSYLLTNPRIRRVRGRAVGVTAALASLAVLLLCATPVPFRARAEGVVWIPDEAFVRARTDGFIDRVVAEPGAQVRSGDVLIVCRDPVLDRDVRVLEGQLREIEARIRQHATEDRVKAQIYEEERRYILERLARARERQEELVIRSGTGGTFVLPRGEDLPGLFVKQGTLLAHVVDLDAIVVRTVVDQTDIALIQHDVRAVEVRFAERLSDPLPAVVKRFVPGGKEELPSAALGSQGGGSTPLDPGDPKGNTAIRKVFEVDLELPDLPGLLNVGGRVYVRFDHGWEPLAVQGYRHVRQLFLRRFNV